MFQKIKIYARKVAQNAASCLAIALLLQSPVHAKSNAFVGVTQPLGSSPIYLSVIDSELNAEISSTQLTVNGYIPISTASWGEKIFISQTEVVFPGPTSVSNKILVLNNRTGEKISEKQILNGAIGLIFNLTISPDGKHLYAVAYISGSPQSKLLKLSAETLDLESQQDIEITPISTTIHTSVSITNDGKTLYIGNKPNNLLAVNTADLVLTNIDLTASIAGTEIVSTFLSTDQTTLHFATGDDQFYHLKTADNSVTKAAFPGAVCGSGSTLRATSDQSKIYVLCPFGLVKILKGSDFSLIADINFGGHTLSGIDVSPDDKSVYVLDSTAKGIQTIDVATDVFSPTALTLSSTTTTTPFMFSRFFGSEIPTIALTASAPKITVGQSVTLTATVTGLKPTGTVQFKNGDTNLGTPVALGVGGKATLATDKLPAGTLTLKAEYSGDAHNSGNITPLNFVVDKASSVTTLTSVPNPLTTEAPLAITVKVTGAPAGFAPTGLVKIKSGSIELATVALDASGVAKITLLPLASGTYDLSADYLGDTNNLPSSATKVSEKVELPVTQTPTPTPTDSSGGGCSLGKTSPDRSLLAGFVFAFGVAALVAKRSRQIR